jgi:NitT/TauT family transport system substrate-binding protein
MIVAGALGLVALFASACGGSSHGNDKSAGGLTKLTVAVGNTTPSMAQVYLAKELGYFKDNGLDVTIKSGQTSIVQTMTTGGADLALAGFSNVFVATHRGKPMTVVYGTNGNGVTLWTVARKNISSIKDCKRFGTYPAGTSAFGSAQLLKAAFKLNFDVIPFNDPATKSAAFASGQVDCANGSIGETNALVSSGKGKLIVDPSNPSTLPAGLSAHVTEAGIFGPSDVVTKKHAAVVSFLKAMKQSRNYLQSQDAAAIATELKKNVDFGTFDPAALEAGLKLEAKHFSPNNGNIDEAGWENTLGFLNQAQLGFPLDNGDFAFSKMVNMSMYDEAAKKV